MNRLLRHLRLLDGSASLITGLITSIVFYASWLCVLPLFSTLTRDQMIFFPASALVTSRKFLIDAGPSLQMLLMGFFACFIFVMVWAMLTHFVLHRFGFWGGLIGGALLGLCVYVISFYQLNHFFEWANILRGPTMLVYFMIVGAFTGGLYECIEVEEEDLEVLA